MPFAQNLALTVLLLATLIFVHELGHFIVAKLFRVKVLKFSLGFGPRLVGFRWGETEYRLSAVPFGGYVKMAGDDPNEAVAPEDRGRGFLEQSPLKRALIALAGPGMNLVFPVLFYFAAFNLRAEEVSSRVGMVDPDMPAYAAGLSAGDRIVAVDGTPVRYFSELSELIGPRWGREVLVAFERGGKTDTARVVPERVEERTLIETEVRGVIGIRPSPLAPVVGVADSASPAARAGLRTFDRIVAVGGKRTSSLPEILDRLGRPAGPVGLTVERDVEADGPAGALTTTEILHLSLEPEARDGVSATGVEGSELFLFSVAKDGPAARAGLARGDRLLEADGVQLNGWQTFERMRRKAAEAPLRIAFLRDGLRRECELRQEKVVRTDTYDNRFEVLDAGIRGDRQMEFAEAERVPYAIAPGRAMARSLALVPDGVRKIALVLGLLVRGDLSFKTVGGPIMMYEAASMAASAGREQFLELMGIISINLAVVNLLPVPILDGFHVLAAAWEAARRRPLSVKARAVANWVGVGLLLLLMALVMRNDIARHLGG